MEPPTGVDAGSGVGGIGVRVGVAVGGDVGVAVGVAGAAVRVGGGTAVAVDGGVGVRVGGGATMRVGGGVAISVAVVAGLGMEVAVAVSVALGEGGTVAVGSEDGSPGRSISRTQPSKIRMAITAPAMANNRARLNEQPPSKSIGSRPARLRPRPRLPRLPQWECQQKGGVVFGLRLWHALDCHVAAVTLHKRSSDVES